MPTQRLAIDSSISLANFPGKLRIKQTLLREVDVTHTLRNLHVLQHFSPSCFASLSIKIVRNMLHHRFTLTWHIFFARVCFFVGCAKTTNTMLLGGFEQLTGDFRGWFTASGQRAASQTLEVVGYPKQVGNALVFLLDVDQLRAYQKQFRGCKFDTKRRNVTGE